MWLRMVVCLYVLALRQADDPFGVYDSWLHGSWNRLQPLSDFFNDKWKRMDENI